MNQLNQNDMDKLDRMERVFGCKMLLPPSKNGLHPFLDVRQYKESGGDITLITSYLMYNGFSFFFNEDGFIEVVGSDNVAVIGNEYNQSSVAQWNQV
jgi:hypothetical protein